MGEKGLIVASVFRIMGRTFVLLQYISIQDVDACGALIKRHEQSTDLMWMEEILPLNTRPLPYAPIPTRFW